MEIKINPKQWSISSWKQTRQCRGTEMSPWKPNWQCNHMQTQERNKERKNEKRKIQYYIT